MSAGHFEAKKHAVRQTQDGWVVSFVVHPNDMSSDFATAPLGTRYMVGFAAIGDDELPASPQPERVDPSTALNTDTSPKQKRPFHTLPLSQQAFLLCKDPQFRKWAGPPAIDNETEAAEFIRWQCCDGNSRSTLDTHPQYAEGFLVMVERFRREVGREAEPR